MVARKRDRQVRVGVTLRVHQVIYVEASLESSDHTTIEQLMEHVKKMNHIDVGTFTTDEWGDLEVSVQDGKNHIVGVDLPDEWSKAQE